MTVLLVLTHLAILAVTARTLAKRRQWRELVVFCIALSVSATLSILLSMEIDVPSPFKLANRLLEQLGLHY